MMTPEKRSNLHSKKGILDLKLKGIKKIKNNKEEPRNFCPARAVLACIADLLPLFSLLSTGQLDQPTGGKAVTRIRLCLELQQMGSGSSQQVVSVLASKVGVRVVEESSRRVRVVLRQERGMGCTVHDVLGQQVLRTDDERRSQSRVTHRHRHVHLLQLRLRIQTCQQTSM